MVQSVELVLDHKLEGAVREDWTKLDRSGALPRGIPDPATHRPHVTLAVADEIYPRVDKTLTGPGWFAPVTVRLGAPVVFQGRQMILARLVVPSAELLALQARIHDLVRDCPGNPAHVAPGTWTPHVTLARRLTPRQVGTALECLGRPRERRGHGCGVRRWDGGERREWLVAGEFGDG